MNAPLTLISNASASQIPAAWIERVFSRMSAMYGAKFADLWRGQDSEVVKETWAECLAGFTGEEIKRGLHGCLQRDWPPTLPEFAKLCRPPIDTESAWREACEQMRLRDDGRDKWSSAAVYWSAWQYGHFELRKDTWEQAKTRWTKLLTENMSKELPDIPARVIAIPAPGKTTISVEESQKRMDSARAALGAMRDGISRNAAISHWRKIANPANNYPLHSQQAAEKALVELGALKLVNGGNS